jgi:hypothetical protein
MLTTGYPVDPAHNPSEFQVLFPVVSPEGVLTGGMLGLRRMEENIL